MQPNQRLSDTFFGPKNALDIPFLPPAPSFSVKEEGRTVSMERLRVCTLREPRLFWAKKKWKPWNHKPELQRLRLWKYCTLERAEVRGFNIVPQTWFGACVYDTEYASGRYSSSSDRAAPSHFLSRIRCSINFNCNCLCKCIFESLLPRPAWRAQIQKPGIYLLAARFVLHHY